MLISLYLQVLPLSQSDDTPWRGSYIAAGKADMRDHPWRNGPSMDGVNLSYKCAFPLGAAPHPKLRGPSLQVHSALPAKATTRLRVAQRAG